MTSRKRNRFLAACAWLTMLAVCQPVQAARDDGIYRSIGYASSLETGEPVYEEHHRIEVTGGRIADHVVDYSSPEGKPVCKKTLQYPRSPYLPAFKMQDFRDAYAEGAEFTRDRYRVFRDAPDSSRKTETFDLGPDHVADAGFDSYVREHLDELLAGNIVPFTFIVAGYLDSLSFRARMEKQSTLFGRRAVTIIVEPDSLLRFFSDPIRVTYGLEDAELLRYEGVTNIRNEKGKRHRARIDYPPAERSYEPT